MTINAISAQALKPAVNFKKAEAPAGEKTFAPEHKSDVKETAAKVIGGAIALAALGFGVYKVVKSRNAKKAEQLLHNKRHATISGAEKQKLVNKKAVDDANRIVAEHDAMLRNLCDHSPKNVELNAMNWDAQPMKREDFMKQLEKNA